MRALPRFLAAAMAVFSFPALSQEIPCTSLEQAHKVLTQKIGAYPVVKAVTDGGVLLVLYADPETGLWGLLMIPDAETACLLASGDGYQAVTSVKGRDA